MVPSPHPAGSPALSATPGLAFFSGAPPSPHGAPVSPVHSLRLPGASPGLVGSLGSTGALSLGMLSPRPGFAAFSSPRSPVFAPPHAKLPRPHSSIESA